MTDQDYGYMSAMRRYATFSGRSPRKEYWMFLGIYVVVSIIAALLDGLAIDFMPRTLSEIGIFGSIVSLVHLVPSFSVTFRRLHDTGRSGWWIGIPSLLAIPGYGLMAAGIFGGGLDAATFAANPLFLVGAALVVVVLLMFLVVFVFMFFRSEEGQNKYGPHPYGQFDTTVF